MDNQTDAAGWAVVCTRRVGLPDGDYGIKDRYDLESKVAYGSKTGR